jgi:hypothetical protein
MTAEKGKGKGKLPFFPETENWDTFLGMFFKMVLNLIHILKNVKEWNRSDYEPF